MDCANSSLFSPDFVYENGLDFSTVFTSSTFMSFPEPNLIIHHARIENDGRQKICETKTRSKISRVDKRMKHREMERQRRQKVTSLFKNLRFMLPSQYIKGKRSSSDHVQEAVNYINDLQKNIKTASDKRDRIKRSITYPSSTRECNIISLPSSSTCTCVGEAHIDFKFRTCLVGMEIVASCCFRTEFCLSSVLQLLAQEPYLHVVSCISTRLHKRFIHTIVTEIEEGIEINFSEFQEKIIKMYTS